MEDKNEDKGEFSAACGIEKEIVREENEIEKNENESEDGVVEHSKVKALESRKICQNFWVQRDLKGVGEWQLQMSRIHTKYIVDPPLVFPQIDYRRYCSEEYARAPNARTHND